MQISKYVAEFKDEVVKKVIDKGHLVVDGAKSIGGKDVKLN